MIFCPLEINKIVSIYHFFKNKSYLVKSATVIPKIKNGKISHCSHSYGVPSIKSKAKKLDDVPSLIADHCLQHETFAKNVLSKFSMFLKAKYNKNQCIHITMNKFMNYMNLQSDNLYSSVWRMFKIVKITDHH